MNRTEYIGKLNALYVGDKNCLEELITAYDEKDKEIERLNNIINEIKKENKQLKANWDKLKEWEDFKDLALTHKKLDKLQSNWNSLREYIEENMYQDTWGDSVILAKYLLDKMNELEGVDNENNRFIK